MILVVTATTSEMNAIRKRCSSSEVQYLVAGVGLVETSFNLTAYLHHHSDITRVVNAGIAGGFPLADVAVLDSCLATSESIGDLGVCFDTFTEPLDASLLEFGNEFLCENSFCTDFALWLDELQYPVKKGAFLSVNGVSGTTRRGEMINQNMSICENMEGAAIARVCMGLKLEWFEFRVISNLVEDRDRAAWQIKPAIEKYSTILAAFLNGYHP